MPTRPGERPVPTRVSELFDPTRWREVEGFPHGPGGLTDVTYHRGCVREASGAWVRDQPVVRVAFMSGDVGAVILTGNGPSPRDGGWAFSSGGDQRVRGRDGYRYEREDATDPGIGTAASVGTGTPAPGSVTHCACPGT